MKKPDWAERKATELWVKQHQDIPHIAAALRAERRRAVRVCQQVKIKGINSDLKHEIKTGIILACDDCARAIAAVKGEK